MNDKTPCIRFKGFTDDWEQRKWIDVVDISTEMVNPTTGAYDNMPHIAPGNIESFTGRILDNVKTVKEEQLISGKFRFRPDDVVYGKINPQLGKYFYATVNGLTSADAYVFNGKNGLNQKFLFSLIQTSDFFNYSVSVSKRSGMPKINRDELNAYSFYMPSEEEQEKIGSSLLQLDNLITLHQRKCDVLINVKKSMLEKMFPKNGKKVPEIRFEGFTDDWEQRKLGDQMYIKSRIGWQALTKKEYLETGDYYLITGTDIDEDKHIVDFNCCYYVSKERYEMDDKIQVYEGDIIVTKDGTIGKVAMVTGLDKPATLNSHLFVLRDLSGKLYNRFLLQVLVSHIFGDFVESTKTGSTLTGLPQKTFVEFRFLMPEMVEQMKIAQYLDNLDNLITLHQRKLEKLQNIKKSMLEKMFI